jgi:DNA-binding CsgD family transcriptional regulator
MEQQLRAERVRQAVIRLCHTGLDSTSLCTEVAALLGQAIPFEAWCAPVADPATLLVTAVAGENLPRGKTQRFFEIEYEVPDFTKFAELGSGPRRSGILSKVTHGSLASSPRWEEVFGPEGFKDELRVAFVNDAVCWGFIGLHRQESTEFTEEEAAYLEGLGGHLAEGLRLALLVGDERLEEATDGPGMLIVDELLQPEMITPAAERWLREIGAGGGQEQSGGSLPAAIYPVISRLRALEAGNAAADVMPRSRLRTGSGRWLVIHASRLSGKETAGKIAVIIEEARPAEMAPLIAQAYGLSAKETELTRLVLRGLSTAEVASEIHLSANTVQDYLKSIFDKVGVRSRRELVASIWSQQYWPRVAAGTPVSQDGWFARGPRQRPSP